jgi:small neutral amino acid transporter SnatA (MarC family)
MRRGTASMSLEVSAAIACVLVARPRRYPAGIVVLVTLSAEASSIAVLAAGVGVLAAVLALDVVVFRWAVRVSSKLDASRMLVTEKVFGFLLAALGVQLALNGLSDVGVIHLTTGLH